MDAFSELFEECEATTVNLRLLWTDKVSGPFLVFSRSVTVVLGSDLHVSVYDHGF